MLQAHTREKLQYICIDEYYQAPGMILLGNRRSLLDLDRDPEPAEDHVRLENFVLERGTAPAGLSTPDRFLELSPDTAHGSHRCPLELRNLR